MVMRPPRHHPDQLTFSSVPAEEDTSGGRYATVDGGDPLRQSTEHVSRPACAITDSRRRKELGAFYTPRPLADFLVRWALPPGTKSVLDPACGDGVFLAASRDHLARARVEDASITGVDTNGAAITAARAALGKPGTGIHLVHSDFFQLRDGRHASTPPGAPHVDAVVGNPPYIRYQLIDADVRERALFRARDLGVHLTQLSSLWAPFVVHAAKWLRPGGRMALVLPAELLHSQYARPVRDFLLRAFCKVTVATFEDRVFPGALTEIILLLAEKGPPGTAGIKVVSVQSLDDLPGVEDVDARAIGQSAQAIDWSGLLAPKAASLLEELALGDQFCTLGSIASVDVGSVTGNNDFFTLTAAELRDAGLPATAIVPVVCKARDVGGAVYCRADHQATIDAGRKAFLLALSDQDTESSLPPVLKAYLASGRRLRVPDGYKCRVRRRWFAVPATGVPTAFLTYMSNDAPRLVMNKLGAWSTNTVHGVVGDPTDLRWTAATFINTVTLLSVELSGRSYGGGVLKLEPTEAERVLVAAARPAAAVVAQRLRHADELIRRGELDALRNENDALLWADRPNDCLEELQCLYSSLRQRRQRRGDRPSRSPEAGSAHTIVGAR